MMKLTAQHRVAILLHEGIRGEHGKTGLAFLRYSDANVVAVIDKDCVGESLAKLRRIDRDVPIVQDVTSALAYHPDVLLIGIAPSGGQLPDTWAREVKQAINAGLSIVNGLHTPIRSIFNETVTLQSGQWLWDVRDPTPFTRTKATIAGARARFLSAQRILTVGTDMSIGKMSASIELTKMARQQGYRAQFLATGQGGMMISGDGIPLDTMPVDFAAGAVEKMVLEAAQDQDDFLFVEGQGSLLHPGSTATLPLLRGAQPTGLILVHHAQKQHIRDFPAIGIPHLSEVVQFYEMVASGRGAFGDIPVKGIALNTAHLDEATAKQEINEVSRQTGLPCNDVVRFPSDNVLSALIMSSP